MQLIISGHRDFDSTAERDSFLQSTKDWVKDCKGVTGCKEYEYSAVPVGSANSQDKARVHIYEVWESQDAFDAHTASDNFQSWSRENGDSDRTAVLSCTVSEQREVTDFDFGDIERSASPLKISGFFEFDTHLEAADFIANAKDMIEESRREPGCGKYTFTQVGSRVLVDELWKNDHGLKNHIDGQYSIDWNDDFNPDPGGPQNNIVKRYLSSIVALATGQPVVEFDIGQLQCSLPPTIKNKPKPNQRHK